MAFPCIRGHHLYSGLIDANTVILDLGGHKGEFSAELNELFGCTCHVIEAMPDLYAGIVQSDRIRTYHYAASDSDGMMSFHVSTNPESNSLIKRSMDIVQTINVPTISIPSFMKHHHISHIDIMKMDIEGAEIAVFAGMNDALLSSMKQITVEFHDFIPELNMEEDVLKVIARLKHLGFACIVFSRKTHFDVLFLNKQFISSFTIFHARFIKYVHGIMRMIKRMFG